MKVLITGASSGIGKELARSFSNRGASLILAARRKDRLEELKNELGTDIEIVVCDLSKREEVFALYDSLKNSGIDILVNNAGFGLVSDFLSADIDTELEMIDVSVKAVHILTRMFLKDMVKKNKGYILNVASSAGLLKGGPLMSTYYATKSYVVSFTLAIYEELRRKKSNVKVSVLCPGPVNTNFNNVAGVKFNIKSLSAEYVAKYAIDQSLKNNKLIIVPGASTKLGVFVTRFLPTKLILKITYKIQERKNKR